MRPSERARAVFAEWMARTGDVSLAAERAGVSERTGRRWKAAPPAAQAETKVPPLAIDATRFIGRKAALVALRNLLTGGARLVTVLGPPGIGKTRLSLRYADLHANAYSGVVFCDVSEASTAEAVCAAVAKALGITLPSRAGDAERAEQIGHALDARGTVLLVLDNFEQAIEAAPATVGVWTSAARRAHVLVTSRVQLRVIGEACFWLEALEIESEAVQLFADRAVLSRPSYELTDEERPIVTDLVRHLDGNALAIELAAARAAVLSPAQLLARLSRRFELLAGGARDAASRQASMRAALDQSWELLDEQARRVLAGASLFRGGFALEAAEKIVSEGGGALDALEALRQCSLVYTYTSVSGMRFGMYETIRDYAGERLAGAERARAARRFAEHFVGSATTADLENLAQAAALAIELGDTTLALRAALAAGPLLAGRAVAEAELLERALSQPGGDEPVRLSARVALHAAQRKKGNFAGAEAGLVATLVDIRAAGKARIEGWALLALAAIHRMTEHIQESTTELDRALALARKTGDLELEASALADTVHSRHIMRELNTETLALAERARELHHKLGARRGEADMCGTLAALHQARGESHQARRRYEEALELLAGGDVGILAVVHTNLGTLHHELGNLDDAIQHQNEALRLCALAGGRRLEGGVLGNRANVLFEMGRLDEAKDGFDAAIRILHDVGDIVHEAYFLAQMSAVIATQGGVDEAATLFQRAEKRFLGSGHGSDMWKLAMQLQRCHIELARARVADAEGVVEVASKLRDDVREHIAALPTETTDDVRIAARMLARALEMPAPRPSSPKPTVGALTVSRDAASVWLPTTARVSLEKRKPVRLVLLRLIEEHEAHPGHPLTVDDLLAAGWPGERVLRDAGASRVYVALGTLRKLGLRDVILSRDGGYLLDPQVKIVVVT